ncbi:MAG: tRNA lysidine(34) synthetase TilS [Deltaproteobacteria bacterium]|nr:tRNA lysidine(34) synthetase TilS [Deltaproteobacteria bacterium]
MPGLIQQVKKTINQWEMLSSGETVVAAVSGGADSVVMLHLLIELSEELGLKVIVAHMDHGLRGRESKRDHDFVKALAQKCGLEFTSVRLEKGALKGTGASAQEAARLKRYAFLEKSAAKYKAQRVALGHTADDQAETVLMRLLKGSSLSGLSGIPPKRGIFIRPLISSSRSSIEEYAKARSISFVTDSSNLTTKYLRNSVRLELIPYLEKKYNPSVKEALARTSSVLSNDDDFIEKAADRAFASALIEKNSLSLIFDRARLLRAHRALSARIFLKAIHSLGAEAGAASSHVEAFFGILKGKSPNASISLPCGLHARREYKRLIVSREAPPGGIHGVFLKIPGMTVIEGSGAIRAEIKRPPKKFKTGPQVAWFDCDALLEAGELSVRQASPGDRMTPFGMDGTRKLKDIFIDAKVPLAQRKTTPVVTSGSEVIWLAGLRQSACFSVSKATRRALRLEFVKEAP